MSTLSVVFGGRRYSVKVTPATSLSQVRDSACSNFGLQPAGYCLSKNGKPLDMSLIFRISGLAPGQTLDLTPCSTAGKPVVVAIQPESGDRVVVSTPSSATLWDILNLCASPSQPSLAKMVDKSGSYLQPVLYFMNREVGGILVLQSTTLQQLGISSGSVLLRLTYRSTGKSFEEVVEIEKEQKRLVEAEKAALEEKRKHDLEVAQQQRAQEEAARRQVEEEAKRLREEKALAEAETRRKQAEEAMKIQQAEGEARRKQAESEAFQAELARQRATRLEIQRRDYEMMLAADQAARDAEQLRIFQEAQQNSLRNSGSMAPKISAKDTASSGISEPIVFDLPEGDKTVSVYPPCDTPFNPSALEIPEAFYEITAEDLNSIREHELMSRREAEADRAVLKTREIREREEMRKWSQFDKAKIRVRFPDRIEIERAFHPRANVQSIFEFVQTCLAHPEHPFILFTSPPVEQLGDPECNLIKRGLVPSALIHFKWKNPSLVSHPFLREDLMSNVREKLPPNWSYDAQVAQHFVSTHTPLPSASTSNASARSITASTDPAVKRCLNCTTQEATLWCESCYAHLCARCNKQVHVGPIANHEVEELPGIPPTKKVPRWFAVGKKL
ncbi:tether containing UBX domain for GLUT4 [Pelomyxa schiedti]|nr:tether containing UBX domain for GLUT4 [Pelomyxa schiedti]